MKTIFNKVIKEICRKKKELDEQGHITDEVDNTTLLLGLYELIQELRLIREEIKAQKTTTSKKKSGLNSR